MTDRSPDRRHRQAGRRQRRILRTLGDEGVWFAGCGWVFGGVAKTEAVLGTLLLRGEVTNDYTVYGGADPVRWWLTPAGYAWLIIDAARDLAACSPDSHGYNLAAGRIERLGAQAKAARGRAVNWKGELV